MSLIAPKKFAFGKLNGVLKIVTKSKIWIILEENESMGKFLVVANWKMNPSTLQEAEVLFRNVQKGVAGLKDVEVIICPPYVYLPALRASAFARQRPGFDGLAFGSQNCHWEKAGAFTGEVSASMIKDAGGQYVILGHSERRHHFGETDELINKKIKAALKERLRPILAIGEKEEEREQVSRVLMEQLAADLAGVKQGQAERIIIAYEPVWAIGTGDSCQANDIMQAGILIRKILGRLYSRAFAKRAKILYGGSVTSKNSADCVKKSGLDGLLVGGASLNAGEFIKIVKSLK